MEEVSTKRYAVVTGANKGIGFATCNQLASIGITVVVTARDEKRGLEAVEKLKELDLSGDVVFHQLDVTDPASIASLADFIITKFGKLDILVNNAGNTGSIIDRDAWAASGIDKGNNVDWSKILTQTYELAEVAVKTNYFGAKEVTKTLIPFLQLSDSPRIVNVSSIVGTLKYLPNGWAKEVLSDFENLTVEKLDDILSELLKDFKEGSLETKGRPAYNSAIQFLKSCFDWLHENSSQDLPIFLH